MLGGFHFFENHQFQFFVPYARIGLVFYFEKKIVLEKIDAVLNIFKYIL